MRNFIRALYRMVIFVILTTWLLVGYWIESLRNRSSFRGGLSWRRKWMNLVPDRIGMKVRCLSPVPQVNGPVMYVCNHRSYLDPIIISMFVEGIILSKSEVARWPLIGSAAKAAGMLFVKRENVESRKSVLDAMRNVLGDGLNILNFPEGTTARMTQLLPFREGGFIVAAGEGIPVIPIAMEYHDPEDAWIDDDTFIRHFFQMFGKRQVSVDVTFGPAIYREDGGALKDAAHQWIENQLIVMQDEILANQVVP